MSSSRNDLLKFAQKTIGFVQVLIFCLVLLPLSAQASPLVTAAYQHAGGSDFAVRITIGSPPPASLIVIQRMPPGVNIIRAQPPAQKIDQANGEAKWLFRRLKPGTLSITVSLDKSVTSNQLSGQVRFKPPGRNAMESIPISNP